MKRLIFGALVALGLLAADPLIGQTPPTRVQLDSLRADAVRARAFNRSAETVYTRVIARLDSLIARMGQPPTEPPPPPLPDTSTTPVPPLPPQEPGDSAGVVLGSSDWNTCVGVTNACWLDGQSFWQVAPSGQPPRSMEVIRGDAVGWARTPNVMQVSMLGPNGNAFVQSNTVIPAGQSFYVRFYVNVATGTRALTNHSVKLDYLTVAHVFWALHNPTGTAYRPFFNITNGNGTGQKQFEPSAIPQGEWHRFEFHVEIYDPANRRFRVWPRVYNAAGNLVLDSDDYANVGSGQTLTAYYAAGGYAQASDLELLRHFAMGNEGPGGSSNTGEKWHYASPAVCSSWCGAR